MSELMRSSKYLKNYLPEDERCRLRNRITELSNMVIELKKRRTQLNSSVSYWRNEARSYSSIPDVREPF